MFDVETYAIIKKRIASGIGGSTSGSTINDAEISEDTMLSSQKIVDTVCPPFSVSGPIVQCTPVENYELGVKVDIVPVQEGEGDPSPENVRPIVGWDNVNVWRAGKNLLDWSKVSASVYTPYGLSFEKKENSIRVFGTSTRNGNSAFNIATTTQSELRGKNFIFSWFTSEENVTNVYGLRTASENAIAISINLTEGSSYDFTIQIAVGTEKLTSYEPYRGETYTVQLGQTVYGGTLDVGTGTLTVDSKRIIIDDPDDVTTLSYSQTTDLTIASIYPVMQEGVVGKNAICSHFFYSQPTYPSLGYSNIAPRIFIYFSVQDYPTIDSVKEFFRTQAQNGSPVQVVYKLASATTIQLTPQQILALSGTNTLYADAGNITVTGVSDPGAAIATLQDRLTALENNTLN